MCLWLELQRSVSFRLLLLKLLVEFRIIANGMSYNKKTTLINPNTPFLGYEANLTTYYLVPHILCLTFCEELNLLDLF